MSLQVGDSVGGNQVRLGSADPDDTGIVFIYIFLSIILKQLTNLKVNE